MNICGDEGVRTRRVVLLVVSSKAAGLSKSSRLPKRAGMRSKKAVAAAGIECSVKYSFVL